MFLMPASRARMLPRQRDLLGYQLTASATAGNNLIITLSQTAPGTDPFMEFRDPNIANGDPFFRQVPNGAQFVINSGNTMGVAANNTPFRLWVLGFDNGGSISVGAINCLVGGSSPTQIFGLDESSVQSPTGGNGGSTAATFYCAQTLTSRPFRILGYLEWSAGLVTAGTWSIKPTKIQLFGPGIKKPGDEVQDAVTQTGTVNSGSTTIPIDNTIPQITEGNEYMTRAITPSSAANVLIIDTLWNGSATAIGSWIMAAIFQDATANALAVGAVLQGSANGGVGIVVHWEMLAQTTSSTTFRVRAGNNSGPTTTFNGNVSGTALLGGVWNSYLKVREIMA